MTCQTFTNAGFFQHVPSGPSFAKPEGSAYNVYLEDLLFQHNNLAQDGTPLFAKVTNGYERAILTTKIDSPTNADFITLFIESCEVEKLLNPLVHGFFATHGGKGKAVWPGADQF